MKSKFKAMVLAVAMALGIGAADPAMANSFPEFSVGPIPEAYKFNKPALNIFYATFAKNFDTEEFNNNYLFNLDWHIDCHDFKDGAHEALLLMRDRKVWWDFRDEYSLKAFFMDNGKNPAFKAFPYNEYRNDQARKAGALVAFMFVKNVQEKDRAVFNTFMTGEREFVVGTIEEAFYKECEVNSFRLNKVIYHYVNTWVEERNKKTYWKER